MSMTIHKQKSDFKAGVSSGCVVGEQLRACARESDDQTSSRGSLHFSPTLKAAEVRALLVCQQPGPNALRADCSRGRTARHCGCLLQRIHVHRCLPSKLSPFAKLGSFNCSAYTHS